MRTTLDIDEDLIAAAKALACREGSTAAAVVSRLMRRGPTGLDAQAALVRAGGCVAGFEPFAARPGVVVSNEQVDALRETGGI